MTPRSSLLSSVRSAVVKLGTQVLSTRDGRLDTAFVATIAHQVARLRAERKIAITLVSSGAIGAGVAELNLPKRPTDLARLQAVAAIGQRRLMDVWADAFESHRIPVAQLLLTREDVDVRARYLNLRNTIHAVHEVGGIPIVNENDTISTDELVKITFGDNDILAATVASALRADMLVLLTCVDGLLDASNRPVRLITSIEAAQLLVRSEKSPLGKGGMNSKLLAARLTTGAGEAFVVADGRTPDVLVRILAGEEMGTLFVPPTSRRRAGRSRWIGTARHAGTIIVDAGAARAITEKNKSLLPAGIVKIDGTFERGDVVIIQTPDGVAIARGLTNYSADDVNRIRGKKTALVRSMLAERAYDEVVHRDNLVLA